MEIATVRNNTVSRYPHTHAFPTLPVENWHRVRLSFWSHPDLSRGTLRSQHTGSKAHCMYAVGMIDELCGHGAREASHFLVLRSVNVLVSGNMLRTYTVGNNQWFCAR